MSNTDEDIADFEDAIESDEVQTLYANTGNPIFIWQLFNHLAKRSRPIPDWVHQELIQVSDRILAATSSQNKKDKSAVKILGLSTEKDFNRFAVWETRDRFIVEEIETLYKRYEGRFSFEKKAGKQRKQELVGFKSLGESKEIKISALEDIAKKHNISYQSVRKIYFKYKNR